MSKKPLKTLRPLDVATDGFIVSKTYVWGTIIVVWLASLLPWRVWSGSPDILLLILAFWCAYGAPGIGLTVGFVFGILMDVHDTNILGRHALTYVLAMYAIMMVRKRMMQFSVFAHFLHVLPIFVLAAIPARLFEAWVEGEWSGWSWMWSGFLMALLWFAADLILKLPTRPVDDDDGLN